MKGQNHLKVKGFITDKSNRYFLLAITIIPLFVFGQVLRFEFVWDDIDIHIINNPYLNPVSTYNILFFWKQAYTGLYIPIAYSLWALIKIVSVWIALKPDDATLYHLANLILHILNGLLVFTLLRQLVQNKWAVLAGTLLFLIHPIQVESVAWVSEFRSLLAFFFGFSALLLYLESCSIRIKKENDKRSLILYLCGLMLFILALLSKPSAVVLPFFIAILGYSLYRSSLKQIISRLWIWILPVIVIFIVTASVQDNTQSYSLWARPLIFLYSISFYLYKLIVPVQLTACYALTPVYLISQWWFYVIWIIPMLIIGCIWYFRKSQPLLMVAFLLFVCGILPVSGLVSFIYQDWSTVADRYLYFSAFGASLAFAVLANYCLVHKKRWSVIVFSVILFWTMMSSFVQVPVWKNPVALWSHVIRFAPAEPRAYYNRGLAYAKLNNNDLAINDFTEAINRGFTAAYNNRGAVYLRTEMYEQAIDDFTKAISFKASNEKAYFNRGSAYLKLKKYIMAIADFDQAIKLNPAYEKAIYNRQLAYSGMKNENTALKERTIEKNNDASDQSLYNIGNSLAQQGKYDLAIHYYSQSIKQNPAFTDALTNRGNCYSALKNYKLALQDYKQVLTLNPSSVMILNNIATSYYFLGDKDKACDYWKMGKELNDPESVSAYKRHCR